MLLLCAAPSYSAGGVSAVVTFTKGKVSVLKPGTKTWEALKTGQFVYQGDTVRTGPASRAGITYTGGIENRLNANTTFKVEPEELANTGEGNKIQMLFGKVWTKILRKGTKFQIHTPVAVCSVRGTEYETDVSDNGHTDVKVYDGVVEFSNEFGSKNIDKNSKSSCDAGSPPADPQPMSSGDKDSWQDEMNTTGAIKLESAGDLTVGGAQDGTLTVLDKKGKTDDKYAKKITITSDNQAVSFSPAGAESWAGKLEAEPAAGIIAFRVKLTGAAGAAGVSVTAAGDGLGATMLSLNVKTVQVKNLKVKLKTGDGKDKELLLKFKAK